MDVALSTSNFQSDYLEPVGVCHLDKGVETIILSILVDNDVVVDGRWYAELPTKPRTSVSLQKALRKAWINYERECLIPDELLVPRTIQHGMKVAEPP
jgi:hypothetical protein